MRRCMGRCRIGRVGRVGRVGRFGSDGSGGGRAVRVGPADRTVQLGGPGGSGGSVGSVGSGGSGGPWAGRVGRVGRGKRPGRKGPPLPPMLRSCCCCVGRLVLRLCRARARGGARAASCPPRHIISCGAPCAGRPPGPRSRSPLCPPLVFRSRSGRPAVRPSARSVRPPARSVRQVVRPTARSVRPPPRSPVKPFIGRSARPDTPFGLAGLPGRFGGARMSSIT